uniref:Uncharacterized protein n=1 Tax=viral metagenome TaxID=1070528 RepID=A0A6C0LA52_9ZZZZ
MNSCTDYSLIENEIANISRIIDNQQQYVGELSSQNINNAYQYEEYVKGQQLKLIRLIKQKINLENKLQSIHEERYKEFEKSNALTGVSDVMSLAFQYAHPIDKRTKKYAVNKNVRSHSPSRRNDDNNRDIVRVYKKDRFEMFLDFLTNNLKILKFICVIALIIIYLIYVFAYMFTKVAKVIG